MYAIYARQSVERKDSISIEMQIEMCRKCLPSGEAAEVFEDKGYSGTNTNRPAFRKMLQYAKDGRLKGIILYKLDRISRSLCDFASLWEEFERQNIELISCTEGIDSKTPMGQMLIKLLIMFAEMEQKNISARIRDNYRARAEKMLSLGGVPPIGYKRDWSIDTTAAKSVRACFYGVLEGKSLDETGRTAGMTGTKVARIIRNPAYVKADSFVIEVLINEGFRLIGRAEDYKDGCGIHAIRSGNERCIAPSVHKGIIEADIWLAARELLNSRKPSSNSGSGKLSWLQGLLICGKCGSSCYVRDNGKGRPYLYITCQGRRKGICKGLHTIRAETVESYAEKILLSELESILSINISENAVENSQTDTEIIRYLANGGDKMSEKIFALERKSLLESRKAKKPAPFQQSGENLWKSLSLHEKKALAAAFIKNIIITEEKFTLILR